MEAQALALRHAIQLLYAPPSSAEQQRADAWLQEFRNAPESWRLCLDILSNPALPEHEAYFAANTLRTNCGRSVQLASMEVASKLLPSMVTCLLLAIAHRRWTVASQLATALALVMLRTTSWPPPHLIPELENSVGGQFGALTAGGATDADGSPLQPAIAHVAMLQVLASLPVACADRTCSVHPNRRAAVSDALATSPHIQPWVAAAFAAHDAQPPGPLKQLHLSLGLRLVHGWCEWGALPLSLPAQISIVHTAAAATLRGETAAAGAEAMVSLINAAKDQGSELLLLLMNVWQEALAGLPLNGPNSLEAHDVAQAVCLVLCAAGGALLPFALGSDNLLRQHFMRVAEQLIGHLTNQDKEVALTALEFWQDTYVATLAGLPSSSRAGAMALHTPLLQHLATSLVLRGQLDPATASCATADARDLPEDVRMVRRELASAMRDITSLVGLCSMSQYVATLVHGQWAALQEVGRPGQASHPWTALECALYAANVVLGQGSGGGGGSGQLGGGGSAHSRRPRDGASPTAMAALVDVCAACISRGPEPPNHPKLLGTALTLVGGLAGWLAEQADALRGALLPALAVTLGSPNEKLSRNAATTLYRLCHHSGLVSVLLASHRSWIEGIVNHYRACGGVRQRIGVGNDLPTEELMLAALCRLASHPTAARLGLAPTLLAELTEPKLAELRQGVAALAACAPAALAVLARGSLPGATGVGGGTPRLSTTGQPPSSAGTTAMQLAALQAQASGLDPGLQQEVARALGLVAGVAASLDVLHMVVESCAVPGARPRSMPQQSIGSSVIESPRGWGAGGGTSSAPDAMHTDLRAGGALHGLVNGLLNSNSSADSRSLSGGMSRTSSFTSGLQGGMGSGSGPSGMGGISGMDSGGGPPYEHIMAVVRGAWAAVQPWLLPALQGLPLVVSPLTVLFSASLRALPPPFQDELLALALQLLAGLPARVLATPKALGLLVTCLELSKGLGLPAAPPPTPSAAGQPLSPQHGRRSEAQFVAAAAAAAASGPGTRSEPGLGRHSSSGTPAPHSALLSIAQNALLTTCAPSTAAALATDPEAALPVLALCAAAVSCLPAVLALHGVLDAVLTVTLATYRTYDIDQCRRWLDWAVQLAGAPFAHPPTHTAASPHAWRSGGHRSSGGGSGRAPPPTPTPVIKLQLGGASRGGTASGGPGLGGEAIASAGPGSPSSPGREGLALLSEALDGGAGAQLVHALLMAACGEMPADMIVPAATALHQVWAAVGTLRFSAWMERAVMELSGEATPWYRLKPDAKMTALHELISPDTEYDVGRFKKLVKAFCGGKRRLGFAHSPSSVPGSRSVSRSNSTLTPGLLSA